MSGGAFDYKQYHIREIADAIQDELDRQGKEKSEDDLWMNDEYYKKNPEEMYWSYYPELVQNKFKEAIRYLHIAEVYAQRVDWFLSGDDGEKSFIERLEKDLDKY